MHRSPSPQSRLLLSLLLSSLVVAAGCRGIQDPDSTEPTPDQPPAAAEVESVSQALAGVWTGVDIGATATGSSSVTGTTGSVTGGGADIWTATDAFRFHYMTVTGDVTITARVASMVTNGGTINTIAKAGVMIRKNLTAGSQNAMMLLTPTATNGYRFQNRPTDNVVTARNFGGSVAGTGWVRLSRVGNVIRSYYSSNGTSWTEMFPVSGSTTPLTLSGLPAAVEVGLAVTSHNTANTLTASFTNITFTPAQNPPSPPAKPANVVPTPGNNQVGLTWGVAAGATSYTVQRSTTSGSGYTDRATGLTTTSFTDSAVNGTQYFYIVRAVNAAGSTPSDEVTATPEPPAPPPAPTGVSATAGNGQVMLMWTGPGATSYNIKFNTDGGSTYAAAGTSPTPSFTHTGRTNNTTYYYVVSAVNSGGESPDSNPPVSATPQAPPPPGAPTTLSPTVGNAQVRLDWSAVGGATSYTVKRSPNTIPRSFQNVQTGITGTTFTNTGLTNGTPYVFVVTANNAGGESGPSPEAIATPTAPPAPTWQSQDIGTVGLTGLYSESSGTHTVRGAGADFYGNADAFRFAYQTVTGDVTITARVTGLALQSGGGTMNVWAKAAVMIRESTSAGARNIATLISPTASNRVRRQLRPTANMATTSTQSATTSTTIPEWLRIERVGNNFRSFHSENGSTWTEVGTVTTLAIPSTALVGLAVTSHSTTQLVNGTFTNVTVTTPTPPAPPSAPTGLVANGQNQQVHLTWNQVSGATSYTVKRSQSPSGPFNVAQSGVADTQFVNNGLSNGTTYYFVVSASNALGSSGDSGVISATPILLRPSVTSCAPAPGATNVATTAFVACEVNLPNVGGGVDEATFPGNVLLVPAEGGSPVPATVNTSGGADVVVLQPTAALEPNTEYDFTITDQLRDLTGAQFFPFAGSFTTGSAGPPPPTNVVFTSAEAITTAQRRTWTSIAMGPDGKIYAGTITGHIFRFDVSASTGLLSNPLQINTVRSNNDNADRALIGMTFDPASTSGNLILWITHGGAALQAAPNWSGKLSRLSGSTLGTYQDYVVNFPRSAKDHMTNSLAFRPTEPGVIYITQGSMNAMGAPDNAWSLRAEHLLAAAIIRVDTNGLSPLPLNIQTNDNDETSAPGANGRYNPFAAGAKVTIHATGVRNAYDILWHSNGELYTATNGSAAGGNSPATPGTLPSACTRRIDSPPAPNYTGPMVPGITSNQVAEEDYLYRILPKKYYGHPNPSRCEWVLNGGNPTSGNDHNQVIAYPVGVQPDRNYAGYTFNFGAHYSPNGMIEWKGNAVPSLLGKLLVIRYSGGDDIIVLTIDPATKGIMHSQTGITGFGGFTDPLDIVQNQVNGDVYVTEYTGQRIWRLRPNP